MRSAHVPQGSARMIGLVVVAILAASSTPAGAQGPEIRLAHLDRQAAGLHAAVPRKAQATAKDPGTATILSVVIVGAGQMYAGDISRGLMMLGGAYGAIILGAIASSGPSCNFASLECSDGTYAPLYVGALAAVGIWVWGIVDAAPTTRRMNKERGLAFLRDGGLVLGHVADVAQLGVRLRF